MLKLNIFLFSILSLSWKNTLAIHSTIIIGFMIAAFIIYYESCLILERSNERWSGVVMICVVLFHGGILHITHKQYELSTHFWSRVGKRKISKYFLTYKNTPIEKYMGSKFEFFGGSDRLSLFFCISKKFILQFSTYQMITVFSYFWLIGTKKKYK